MSNIFKLCLLLLLLPCCQNYEVQRRCLPDEARQKERADFVIECARVSNPKSDEEPEDMIAQCQKTADEILCARTWAVTLGINNWTACAHASADAQWSCRQAGWGK